MKKGSVKVRSKEFTSMLDWFEENYTPGELGGNGNPRAAEIVTKGVKGNIVIRMMYEKDIR